MSLCGTAEARAVSDLAGDIDNDGQLTRRDVRLLVDYLLGKPDTLNHYNGFEIVDLGLPSGQLWATMNVEATQPSEPGGYYAWGETEEKDDYSWDTYKWGTDSTLTRYCRNTMLGMVDSLVSLINEDDVARQRMGGRWRMPSLAEVVELREQCSWNIETLNGQEGYRATGPNGNTIFLPMAGFRTDTYYGNEGIEGTYWTRELNYATDDEAYCFHLLSYSRWWAIRYRYTGRTVRACAHSPRQIYDVNQDGRVSLADLTALINLINSD